MRRIPPTKTCGMCARWPIHALRRTAAGYWFAFQTRPPTAAEVTFGWWMWRAARRVNSHSRPQETRRASGRAPGSAAAKWRFLPNGAGTWGGSVLLPARRGELGGFFPLPMSGGEAHAYELKVTPVVDESADDDAIPPKKSGEPLTRDPLPLDVDGYDVSPDGGTIAVLARDPQTAGEKKQKDAKADALWLNHDRHGKRLYLLDSQSEKLTPVAVPPDVASIAWSRQNDRLIALTQGPNHAGDLGPDAKAWLVEIKNPDHPTQIKEVPATVEQGSFSDDGS